MHWNDFEEGKVDTGGSEILDKGRKAILKIHLCRHVETRVR